MNGTDPDWGVDSEYGRLHDVLLCEPENFNDDGLHPSPLGHRHAARAFAELLHDRYQIPISIEGGTR